MGEESQSLEGLEEKFVPFPKTLGTQAVDLPLGVVCPACVFRDTGLHACVKGWARYQTRKPQLV